MPPDVDGVGSSSASTETTWYYDPTLSRTLLVRGTPPSLIPPDYIGPFRVEREIGRGGMGIVYLAEEETLGRRVAVKIIQPELAALPEFRERFLREGRAMASMDGNKYLVPIYRIDLNGGVPYIVMPFLNGESLEERLKRGPQLSVRAAARVARQTLHGLADTHKAGLIHRDIKPGNIFLEYEPSGRFRWVRLLDFGLARSVRDTVSRDSNGVGTPMWMSPEQHEGRDLEARTDVFSAGMVLFRMLAGRHPFAASSYPEQARAVIEQQAPSVMTISPKVPEALARLVEEMLSKEPAHRPSAADAALGLALFG
jgi:eukaryotic-like serine/threonine-protein kinase